MTNDLTPSRKAVVRSIVGINLFFILFGLWVSWMYHNYAAYLLETIEQQRPLLVFQLQQTALLFVWVPIAGILIAANIEMVFVKLLKRQIPRFLAIVQKIATYVVFLGLALVVFGTQLANPQWAKTFSEAGYSRCETVVLRANKQFFNDAWVLEAEDCYDPVLKQILHNDHSSRGFEKGARYLDEKHTFLRDYNAEMEDNAL